MLYHQRLRRRGRQARVQRFPQRDVSRVAVQGGSLEVGIENDAIASLTAHQVLDSLGPDAELHVYADTDSYHAFFTTGPVVGLRVDDVDATRAALAFRLGTYRFDRYRRANGAQARLVSPKQVDRAEVLEVAGEDAVTIDRAAGQGLRPGATLLVFPAESSGPSNNRYSRSGWP